MGAPDVTHFVFSLSGAGLLRQALQMAGRQERVIGFPDQLGYGPIDPSDPVARVDWIVRTLGFAREHWDWMPENVNTFWEQASAPGQRRLIWTTAVAVNEYSGFLEWVWRFGDSPYEVIDLTEVELDRPTRDGGVERRRVWSVALLPPNAVASAALWDRSRSLESAELETLRRTWAALRRDNAPLRIIGREGLRSAPLSAFDEGLLSFATGQWRRALHLIGYQLAYGTGDYFQVGDAFLACRVLALVNSGRLELRLPPELQDIPIERWGQFPNLNPKAEVRLPQFGPGNWGG